MRFIIKDSRGQQVSAENYQREIVSHHRKNCRVDKVKDDERSFVIPYAGGIRISDEQTATIEFTGYEEDDGLTSLMQYATIGGRFKLEEVK